MQSYDPTIHIPSIWARIVSSVWYAVEGVQHEYFQVGQSVVACSLRLRDLALEAALDTALDRPNHGSWWAAERVAFSQYRKVGLPRPLARNG